MFINATFKTAPKGFYQVLKERLKNKELKKVRIVTYFEDALRRSIKLVFSEAVSNGCYFYFTKFFGQKQGNLDYVKKSI